MVDYKGYRIQHHGRFPKHIISSIGKGALPKALKASYVSEKQAKEAIDSYLNSKKSVEGSKNGKKQIKSGDQ